MRLKNHEKIKKNHNKLKIIIFRFTFIMIFTHHESKQNIHLVDEYLKIK